MGFLVQEGGERMNVREIGEKVCKLEATADAIELLKDEVAELEEDDSEYNKVKANVFKDFIKAMEDYANEI